MRWMIILLFGYTVWASPIHKTIDQLLENEDKRSVDFPQYDPFKKATPLLNKKSKKLRTHKPLPIRLSAVLNNRAYINGKWYKKGDLLSEGKIMDIRKNSVYLKKANKIKILNLKRSKNIFTLGQKDGK